MSRVVAVQLESKPAGGMFGCPAIEWNLVHS